MNDSWNFLCSSGGNVQVLYLEGRQKLVGWFLKVIQTQSNDPPRTLNELGMMKRRPASPSLSDSGTLGRDWLAPQRDITGCVPSRAPLPPMLWASISAAAAFVRRK